jgi:xanthine/uracil permease
VIGLPLLAGVGIIAMPDIAGNFPPWAAAVVASPLATATILALVLNLALNAGVSSRASTTTRLTPTSARRSTGLSSGRPQRGAHGAT